MNLRRTKRSSLSDFDARTGSVAGFIANPGAEIRRSMGLLDELLDESFNARLRARGAVCGVPRVSVIMPMYNASRWVATALRSLRAQDEDIEILAVDDASTDDTFERAREAAAGDPRVRLYRLQRNVGAYQIRNWAASQLAHGEWLSFQDADDFSHPNRFSLQLAHANKQGAEVCGTFAHQFFPQGQLPLRVNTEVIDHAGYQHSLSFYPELEKITEPRPVWEVVSEVREKQWSEAGRSQELERKNDSLALYATFIVRRRVFLGLGGFEGRTRVGGDRTLAHRLVRLYNISNVPAVLYSRRIHDDSLTQKTDTGYLSTRRQAHFSEFDRQERRICAALSSGQADRLADCCRSDLYCGDVSVAEEAAPP